MTAAAAPTSSAPQCNRVTLTGEIIAIRERGTFMGNRTSPPRWLICDLHFKRDLKEPRKYAKLSFLDEAVALAAVHRPCNTCRHERYQTYLAAVKTESARPSTLSPTVLLFNWARMTIGSNGLVRCTSGHQRDTSVLFLSLS